MSDTFTEIKQVNKRVQRHMDRITNLVTLAGMSEDRAQLMIVKRLLQEASDDLTADSERLSTLFKQFKEERQMFKIPMTGALVILALFLIFGLVSAQDAPLATNTPIDQSVPVVATVNDVPVAATIVPIEATAVAPTSDAGTQPSNTSLLELVKSAMPWIAAIGVTFLIIIGVLGRELIVGLVKSAPVPVREAGISAGESLLNSVEGYAKTTTTVLDDAAIAELRKLFGEFVVEIRASPTPPADQPGLTG